jgi:Type IV pilin-like G and H, putative
MIYSRKRNDNYLIKLGIKLGVLASSSIATLVIFHIVGVRNAYGESLAQGCSTRNAETTVAFLDPSISSDDSKQVYRCGFRPPNTGEMNAIEPYLDSLLRAQSNFFTQQNSFSNNLQDLQVELPAVSSYEYFTDNEPNTAVVYSIPRRRELRSYVGGVFSSSAAKVTILCIANRPGTSQPAPPLIRDNQVVCGRQTTEVYNYQSGEN